jgi:hypothetical protein
MQAHQEDTREAQKNKTGREINSKTPGINLIK